MYQQQVVYVDIPLKKLAEKYDPTNMKFVKFRYRFAVFVA